MALGGGLWEPSGYLETGVALRETENQFPEFLLSFPAHPSTQPLTCKIEDLYYIQGLVEPRREVELS